MMRRATWPRDASGSSFSTARRSSTGPGRGKCLRRGHTSGPTTIEARREDRFVDTGEIVTAAGVSAGIDMALHLVARLHSVERAREVRRYIQYDPEPPV
jgi:hypothetical protein